MTSDPKIGKPEILAPVDREEEVAPLLDAGAHWLYGGCVPVSWGERYPATVPLNQRTFASAQFDSLEGLARAVRLTEEGGGRFALTLNAPFYMDSQVEAALEMARFAEGKGASALIVGDPGLIRRLGAEGIGLPIHLSTMAVASNPAAVRFFADMGVRRVILPRFLDVGDIKALLRDVPDMEFEAFILVGKCPNIEGLCSFLHDSPDRRWPCEWPVSISCADGEAPPEDVCRAVDGTRLSDRRDACGLCALPALVEAGVSAFKVVGRGAPTERKVGLVRALSTSFSGMDDPAGDWTAACRDTFQALFGHPCTAHNCYYPRWVDSLSRE